MEEQKENLIVKITLEFSVLIVEYCEALENEKKFVVARQLLKSATSIGANVREAQHGESKADFIHKLKVAMKECEETIYWLEICKLSKNYAKPSKEITEKIDSIHKILNKIISTTFKKQ